MAQTAQAVELRPETLEQFESYIKTAEAAMDGALQSGAPFFWSERSPQTVRRIRDGHIVAEFWSGTGPAKITKGLIHDWVGAALVPEVTVSDVLALIQDYDHHKNIYAPEVIDSKLLSRRGNDFRVYLRLLK